MEMRTNIGSFLAKRARLDPAKVGLVFEGREITYAEWNAQANCAAMRVWVSGCAREIESVC